MIIASGVVEIKGGQNIDRMLSDLKTRGLVIDDVDGAKVRFQIARETIGAVKSEMDMLRQLDDVRNLHITYYSHEDAGIKNGLQDRQSGAPGKNEEHR